MGRFVFANPQMTYANTGSTSIDAGDVVICGKTAGIAWHEIPAGESGVLALGGVWELPCASVTASQGALAYWDSSNKRVTATASTNLQIGSFMSAVVSTDTSCLVNITQTGVQAAG